MTGWTLILVLMNGDPTVTEHYETQSECLSRMFDWLDAAYAWRTRATLEAMGSAACCKPEGVRSL